MRLVIGLVVVVVFGLAIAGVGTGGPPPYHQPAGAKVPAPTGARLAASKRRIEQGSALVRKGRDAFADEGCDACHSIAATGAKGRLGPRLDVLYDPERAIEGDITQPRAEIVPGFQGNLMPADYAKRLEPEEIRALAAFIKAASGAPPR